jgi:VCBS repeat-containing protein
MTEQPTTAASEPPAESREQAVVSLERPAAGAVTVAEVAHAGLLRLKFQGKAARIAVMDVDLVMLFEDGGKIIVPGLALRVLGRDAPRLLFEDGEVSPQAFFARVDDVQLADQLPQLALSRALAQDPQQQPQQAQQPPGNGIPVVQLPTVQTGSLTPLPARTLAIQGSEDAGQLDLTTGRFLRRSNLPQSDTEASSSSASTQPRPEQTRDRESAPAPNQVPRITSDGGGPTAAITVDEGARAVTTVAGTDPDSSTLRFAIVGGTDAARFAINSETGKLQFAEPVNAEDPSHVGAVYSVAVAAVDGRGGEAVQTLSITVRDVNEAPVMAEPVVMPVDEDAAANTVVARAHAADPDRGDSVTYSFAADGDSGGRFLIDSGTGEITLRAAGLLDHEANTRHVLTVVATDRLGLSVEGRVVIDVGDVNDAPVILSDGGGDTAVIEVPENELPVTRVVAVDEDAGATVSYAIAGGVDAARFTIDSATGVLRFVQPPDHDVPADADGDAVFEVIVSASDGTRDDRQTLLVTVANRNEAPTALALTGSTVSESSVAGDAVGTVSGSDPDAGDTLTYTFAPLADGGGRFVIDAASGRISVAAGAVFNFEDAATHLVVVTATDAGGLALTRAFEIRVNDVNEVPVIISDGGGDTATVTVAEGVSAITAVTAIDPDADTALAYSIVGGTDAARFAIDAVTGSLRLLAVPDFEAPADTGGDNIYVVEVQASDGVASDRQTITVVVANVNEAPIDAILTGSVVDETAVGGTPVGVVSGVDPDLGDTLSYVFATGGDGGGRFVIDAVTGALTVAAGAAFNFEASPFHLVLVTVTDAGGLSLTKSFVIQVRDQNDPPVITSDGGGGTATVFLNEGDTFVTTTTATDPDAGTLLTYSIQGGVDAALFRINATTGVLQFIAAPDFETPGDADGDNAYEVVVAVSDGSMTDAQALTVVVGNRNEPPVIVSDGGGAIASLLVVENQTAVTTVSAVDPDAGSSLVYLISGGADAARFHINPATGILSFVDPPDIESPTDANLDGIYEVEILVSDGQLADTQLVRVTVTNQNEPPVIISDGGGPTATRSIDENQTAVGTVVGSDPDQGTTLVYSIVGGADAARFAIVPLTGALTFVSAPDFEAPASAAASNSYEVVLRVTDGQFTADQTLTVTVNDVAEAPRITSDGGGATANVVRVENGTAVTTVTATDQDAGSVLTFRISGGSDAARFTINATTGALAFAANPNFEAPTDSNLDNIYQVIVEVSDGALVDTQTISVQVANQNEAPTITSLGGGATASTGVAENSLTVGTMTATDPDAGATRTWSIAGGADAARFVINAASGLLSFASAPNFEVPTDVGANNVYNVTIRVSDGSLTDTQDIAVTVNNVNEAPVSAALAGSSVAENAANGTVIGSVTGTDPDAGATLSYAFTTGGNAGGRFAINASTGQITVANGTLLNFEAATSHAVTVRVSDQGGLFLDQTFTISLSNVNEAPAITANGGGATAALTVPENQTAVVTMTAADPDAGTTLVWSISGGADAARFAIDAGTGALTFVSAPDREAPTDANLDNVYDVTVRVTDGTLTDTQAISVTVGDANDAPTNINPVTTGVFENAAIGTVVGTASGADPDAGDTLTYSFAPGGDASGRFAINATTGQITVANGTLLDYEAATSHLVTVRVTDSGGLTFDRAFGIPVLDLNEAPVIASNGGAASAALSLGENQTALLTFAATDQDAGSILTWSISGGADAARFTINATTGALAFASAPNFEAPTDVGANNVYDVIVRVSDGALTDTQTLAITVTNVNEAPTGASLTGGAVNENAANGTVVGSVTGSDPDAGATLAYAFAPGGDAGGRFAINATSGQITVANGTLLDREAAASHGVTVRVTDQGGLFTDVALTLTVNNVNEAPVIGSNGGAASAALNVSENATAVMTFAASDPDAGAVLSWSISGGADAARFSINATTGALTFVTAPNFEAPADAGANNVYDVIVRVSDGTLTDTQALAITVLNVNETPVIAGGASLFTSLPEGQIAVATIAATDPEGSAVTYGIGGGADAALFAINPVTGALSFVAPPNFEAPGDAGANNVYDVVVTASDGVSEASQAVSVTVTDVNQAPGTPTIQSVAASKDYVANGSFERFTGASDVGYLSATDLVSWNRTAGTGYELVRTPSNGAVALDMEQSPGYTGVSQTIAGLTSGQTYHLRFDILNDAGSATEMSVFFGGVLVATQALAPFTPYQTPLVALTAGSGDGSDILEFRETGGPLDGQGTKLDNVRLYRATQPEASITENAANGSAVMTVAATDDGSVTYTLDNNAGGRFAIDAGTGVVTVADGTLLDFEGATFHDIIVRATDGGGLFSTATHRIHVADSVPMLLGTTAGDTLTATFEGSLLQGLQDNDTLHSGAGNDTLDGGSGLDYASYVFAPNGVTVDLAVTSAQNTGHGVDTLIGIEAAEGSHFADTLLGDSGNNVLLGQGGNDSIDGRGGDDYIDGGGGADTLYGENGNDVIIGSGGARLALFGGNGNDIIAIDVASLATPGTVVSGGAGADEVFLTSGVNVTLAQLVGALSEVETIDLTQAGLNANLTNATGADIRSILGITSGTGELTLRLDGGDNFSAAATELTVTAGNTTIFYDMALTELARVTIAP